MKKLILLTVLGFACATRGQDNSQLLDPGQSTDRQLLKQVQMISDQSKTVKASVTNGFVTLEGHVKTDMERRSLEGAVGQVAGVKQIENNLTISPAKEPVPGPIK